MQHPTESALDTLLGAGFEVTLQPATEAPAAGDFWDCEIRISARDDGTYMADFEQAGLFSNGFWREREGHGNTPAAAVWDMFTDNSEPCPADLDTVINRLWRWMEIEFIKSCPKDADWNGPFRSPAFRKAILASAKDEFRPEIGNDPHFPAARRLASVG